MDVIAIVRDTIANLPTELLLFIVVLWLIALTGVLHTAQREMHKRAISYDRMEVACEMPERVSGIVNGLARLDGIPERMVAVESQLDAVKDSNTREHDVITGQLEAVSADVGRVRETVTDEMSKVHSAILGLAKGKADA